MKKLKFILYTVLIAAQPFSCIEDKFMYALSRPKKWIQLKEIFKDHIKSKTLVPGKLNLKGFVLKNIDFSEMDLKGFNFTNCTFIDSNLEKSDLTDTRFEGATFKRTSLNEAIIGEELIFDGQKSPLELVRWYSDILIQKEICLEEMQNAYGSFPLIFDFDHCFKEKQKIEEQFHKRLKALNNVLGPLNLDLSSQDLRDLWLSNINLNNACLKEANLQGVNLSGANLQDACLKNACLQNTSLSCADLSRSNLKDANLENAKLSTANLRSSDLTNCILKNACLEGSQLQGARLSKNVVVPSNYKTKTLFEKWDRGSEEEQILYQKFVNAQIELFRGVPNRRLKQVCWKTKNLKNANFTRADLQKIDFRGLDLENAIFLLANLKHADFTEANLTNTLFSCSDLKGARFARVRLSDKYVLPDYYHLKDLHSFYASCPDETARYILKDILNGI